MRVFFILHIFKALLQKLIMKTCLCNFVPLKPHFYKEKMGFAGVSIIFSYFCYKT